MAKNKMIDILARLNKIEKRQEELAVTKVAEAAAAGETITLEEATTPSVTARSVKEIPTGSVNGVNVIFYLNDKPLYKTEEVYLGGILLTKGADADYTVDYTNKIITMNYPPEIGYKLEVSYNFIINGV